MLVLPAADPHPDVLRAGDRVVAAYDIGPFRPRVPRGIRGEVAALSPTRELEVHFANGRAELVRANGLAQCAAPSAMSD
jgi:hypothetical protein